MALLDQGLHIAIIASAFLIAGFQYAIGTLRKADDEMIKAVAVDFYDNLLFPNENPLSDENIPLALHRAVKSVLKTWAFNSPVLWALYAHFGG